MTAAIGDADHAVGPDPAETPEATLGGVSVVVVTYNSAGVVADCLASLPAALGDLPHQVVVVDNDSSDDTLRVAAAAAPSAVLLPMGDNRGYAAAANAGIARIGTRDAVLVLNPDLRLEPGAVVEAWRHLGRRTGVVVPSLVDEAGHRQRSQRREPSVAGALAEAVLGGRVAARLGVGEVVEVGGSYDRVTDVDWATGAAMLVSAECLERTGPFDESFFLYSEETDFMLRARDLGWRTTYVPGARALHVGGDLSRSPRLWAIHSVNRVRLHRRRHGRASTAAFLGASLLGEGVRAAAGRATCREALGELLREGPRLVAGPPPAITPARPGWICFSAHDWWYFSHAHSDFQLMQRVARDRPVLFVNSIGLRMPMPGRSSAPLKRLARKAGSLRRYVRTPDPGNPGFHVMSPVPLPFYGSALTRRLGAWMVRTQVELVARSLGIVGDGRPDPVIAVTLPTAIGAASSMPHSALVVNRSDKHSSFAEARSDAIEPLEEQCVTTADRVFFTAVALREAEAAWAGGRARDLDHGVDLDLFAPSERPLPADIAAVAEPRIGFFGALRDHLVDLELLEQVARELPGAQLVLVGPVSCPPERVAALRALPNVHFLGGKEHEEVPDYGRAFDVAIMPWRTNEWMTYANPIKMKEYLALGLPVVSTDFPEVHRYEHLVRIAADRPGFVDAVRQTLDDGGLGTPAQRRDAVAGATWDAAAAYLVAESEAAARGSADGSSSHPGSRPAGPSRPADPTARTTTPN